MTPRPLRVVKVGGSLLRGQPDAKAKENLSAALTKWLAKQSPAVNVLIAGGGELADVIRQADQTHGLGEEVAHWLCVDALTITARLLGIILKAKVIARTEEVPAVSPAICIFDPAPFLRGVEPLVFSKKSLPHTWAVSSDSIAARIAEFLAARELVLLKSWLPAPGGSPEDAVDGYFSTASADLDHVRLVNLRDPDFHEIVRVRG